MTTLERTEPLGATPTLADLDDAARYLRFDGLQQHMGSVWDAIGRAFDDEGAAAAFGEADAMLHAAARDEVF